MHHYSKNIERIQNIFSVPNHNSDNSQLANFKESQKYKSLAVLLANAELATPELNRKTVKRLLNGEIEWNRKDGTKFKFESGIDIELLEQLGLLSFHADYCSVNTEFIRNKDELSESVKPYYEALIILQDIIYGKNYIKPHFQINKKKAKALLQSESIFIELDTIEELSSHGENYQIKLQRRKSNNLLPEYLWQEFFKPTEEEIELEDSPSFSKKEKQAFSKWLLTTRVYSEHFLWGIRLDYLDDQRKSQFLNYSFDLIKNDVQLKKSHNTLENQWRCQSNFTEMLFQYNDMVTISFNASGQHQTNTENIQPSSRTIDEIHEKFINDDKVNISNLAFTHRWHTVLNTQYPRTEFSRFYDYPKKIADSDIYVNSQSISSRGKLDELHLLANDRPELRHILFNVLTWSCKPEYLLYLLCKKETTTTAVYLFSQPNTFSPQISIDTTTDSLHHHYFPFVCDEFLNISFNDRYERLPAYEIAELLMILAKDSISKSYTGESRVDKDCLDILLNSFTLDQVVYFANELLAEIIADTITRNRELPVWKLYLLFWLLEKNQDFNLFTDNDMPESIQSAISNAYIAFFKTNLDNGRKSIFISEYEVFDFFPWWRINSNYLTDILDLIPNPAQWLTKHIGESAVHFNNQGLTRNYFHLMLCLQSKDRCKKENKLIIEKIIGLLESCGFSDESSKHVAMFNYEHDFGYRLWKKFTLIINDLDDNAFDRALDLLKNGAPLTRKLDIFSQINKESRKTELLGNILSTPQDSLDGLGIKTLEKALTSALYLNQLSLANTLLDKGLSIINDENSFLNCSQNTDHSTEIKNNWLFYQYETELLNITNNDTLPLEEKKQSINSLEYPDFSNVDHDTNRYLSNKCSRFRRTVFAMVIYETEPETSYRHFNQLYKEDRDLQHSSNRLAAKLAILDAKKSTVAEYQHALSQWKETIVDIDIQDQPTTIIQNWFHCLEQAKNNKELDFLWLELSEKKQNTIEIATIYCKSLVHQNDVYPAKLILDKLKKYHNIEDLGETSEKLLKELSELIISGHEPTIIVALTNKLAHIPRSNDELSRSYQEIMTKNLADMIRIIRGSDATIEHFLFDHISSVVNELQLRKKSLNIKNDCNDKNSFRIINEDPINDWVTSLFDHRLSEMNFSCRDQKRGGESASKKTSGEIDFFICDKNNNRIAIMEAFRLFSNDSTVITQHLDKLAGYDQECLSPVFVISYCDVKDFSKLAIDYKENVSARGYSGFRKLNSSEQLLCVLNDSATIQSFSEIRYRDNKPITIYHLLANLHFES